MKTLLFWVSRQLRVKTNASETKRLPRRRRLWYKGSDPLQGTVTKLWPGHWLERNTAFLFGSFLKFSSLMAQDRL
jgi:hypothetical protein